MAKDDYQAQSDAQTLQNAAEIHADPKRHKAAHVHLSKTVDSAKAAHKASSKTLNKKVKKGLEKAFPKSQQDAQQNPAAVEENNESGPEDE